MDIFDLELPGNLQIRERPLDAGLRCDQSMESERPPANEPGHLVNCALLQFQIQIQPALFGRRGDPAPATIQGSEALRGSIRTCRFSCESDIKRRGLAGARRN